MLPCEHGMRAADDGPSDLLPSKGGVYMGYRTWRGWMVLCALMALPALSMAQQATKKSDVELSREGPAALATAHGETPRYGGKFISAGVEAVPLYDMHQTSFGGVYAATAPAYNCLVRTSPYDPMGMCRKFSREVDVRGGKRSFGEHTPPERRTVRLR